MVMPLNAFLKSDVWKFSVPVDILEVNDGMCKYYPFGKKQRGGEVRVSGFGRKGANKVC